MQKLLRNYQKLIISSREHVNLFAQY